MDAMEQGGGGGESSDDPLAPPPLPAHAPSAALVAMEEGDGGTAAATGGEEANTQAPAADAASALPSPPSKQGRAEEGMGEERPWARLRLVTPEAGAELEGVVRALEAGQRRLEALGACRVVCVTVGVGGREEVGGC